jgi:hypothetical protein
LTGPARAVYHSNGFGTWAGVAQLVEYELPKLGVAGSNPVARSIPPRGLAPRRFGGEVVHGNFRQARNEAG